MKISTKKKCDKLISDYEKLKKQGIELTIIHGKYGYELTMVDNNATSPGDYIVAVMETGL
jgi:hypothetical protein